MHNCGPRDVEIKNTLINIESEAEPLKWTTERLKAGIPKGGSFQDLKYIGPNETEGNSLNGNGGQYYEDPNNERALIGGKTAESNILWESFNTKHEIYRDCGLVLVDGGWKNKPSNGVNNVGVASKGMPVRVFTGSTDLQIVDYNIGNVTEENNFQGDYSHLPKLKPGESLDLFFGIRINRLANINENIQLVFNTDDGSIKKSDCYAEIQFPIKLNDVIEPEPIEVIERPLEPETCAGISDYLPIDSEGRIYALQVFTLDWEGIGYPAAGNWIGGPDGSGCDLVHIPDNRGTFGAGIPFGINDTRADQSAHPPAIQYSFGTDTNNVIVKSSYIILKDNDIHDVPSPYSTNEPDGIYGVPSISAVVDGMNGLGGLLHPSEGSFFGTILVPPGWEIEVWSSGNYSCVDQFTWIKGPLIFHAKSWNSGFDGPPGVAPVSQDIKDLYAAENCNIWKAMANIKNIPVRGHNSQCIYGDSTTGLLARWNVSAGIYYTNQGRLNNGGYSFRLRKISVDENHSGSYVERGYHRFAKTTHNY